MTPSKLLINPVTQRLIDTFVRRPSHGLLLTGQSGVGLMTIARYLAAAIDQLGNLYEVVPDEKGTITIEIVRGLYKLTRTHRETALVIIIDDADKMGREAQNALLKLLEEPVEHVYFIMTTHAPQLLLPTIHSRVQHIEVLPLAQADIDRAINSRTAQAVRAQLLFLASGLPAELARLQADDAYFTERSQLIKDARSFLQGDTYARFVAIKNYSGERNQAQAFLAALSRLLSFTLFTSEQPSIVSSLEAVEMVSERLGQNAHVRTQLAYLVTLLPQSGTM